MDRETIERLVLKAIAAANEGRPEGQKLQETAAAPLFGPQSTLDSLGLVALLIDIEELFAREGMAIVLSDERAMSQRRSPYRDVPALVGYIEALSVDNAPS